MGTLAILLTVHDRKAKTIECLKRVHDQLPIDGWETDVYLTDDGCTDGTPEAVSELFPLVNIIQGDGNLFWNRGMRLAWKTAANTKDYDAYLWLNDDTNLLLNAISVMISALESEPDSIIVGSTANKNNNITYGGRLNCKLILPNGELQRCNTFNGNCVLVSRYAFSKIGNLDNAYSHSLGDIDYGLCAARLDIKVYVAPVVIGYCEKNPLPPKWMRPELSLHERYKALFTPLAYTNPPEYFHFKRKHWGVFTACLAMCSITLHLLAPKLWQNIKYTHG
ncbi:glycosyltransferase family 2 protein [uncultured Muribaculum sp.]|uniref:glycosyltransferase family 2 protein n=1 Tax=uncultured Muribaculum sp. TaxID=1918613 RepID=UPI0025E723E3|nr:glycosyltransferase family 2 protein [uncultured Muribaculum sp.]